MTWFWQHQNDRHPFHPLFWFVQSNLENLFAEKVWYRPKLTFILSFADDMLMICWLVGHVTCLRAQATQVCVEGSEAALPKTPPRRRDCGSGQWFKRKWKVFHKLLHSFKSTLLGLKSFFNWSRRSWLKPLSPQCSHVLPHVRCLSHCHPAKRPGENESPLQAQLWSCVGYNVYNIFVPCITHIANMLRICWIIFL